MSNIIDLRSDTVTKPSAFMREAIASAVVGDDVYNEDPTVIKLQTTMAELTGKEAALYVSSGTMGNQLCVKCHTEPGDEIIVEYSAHIFQYETAAASFISRAQIYPVPGKYGMMKLQDIEDAIRPDIYYFPKTKLICLENTHNRAGGTILDINYIADVHTLAKAQGIKTHLDGARLWNASAATGISISEYAKYFDSLSICLSKGLGAPVGSVICGSVEFIEKARKFRKILGGGLRQSGLLAAAGLYAINNNFDRLKDDHKRAKIIAEFLNNHPAVDIDMNTVQTNIVIFGFHDQKVDLDHLVTKLKNNGLLVSRGTKGKLRIVTHLDANDEDIERAIQIMKDSFTI
jgi:threonine aldolase